MPCLTFLNGGMAAHVVYVPSNTSTATRGRHCGSRWGSQMAPEHREVSTDTNEMMLATKLETSKHNPIYEPPGESFVAQAGITSDN
ncbi:hypothetical protein GDO78_015586 [Eleutherodactylus coqui]|uniref:Uncharacterized protein n=1 Tax=Eleutherodactylus coqui TaxID=57060 RepID=A0A8J6EDH1_ELECQ|nr:hypothetical protein GDO78_015586 [Eleutherodactylus coqui]